MEQKVFFITGIDTGVGKTYATGLLARAMAKKGLKVTTQKLVQTGCKGISDDILMHRKLMNIVNTQYDISGKTCSYLFRYPASPHLAARLENKHINPAELTYTTQRLLELYDYVLIEGAGGMMAPLADNNLTIEYVCAKKYPVILVTNGRLGSINHTLMNLIVSQQYDLKVIAVVFNRYPSENKTIEDSSYQFLSQYIARDFPETKLIELPKHNGGRTWEKLDLSFME